MKSRFGKLKGVGAGTLLNLIIAGVIGAVVFGAVIGTIADNTIGISGTGNVTGATATLVDLVPLFVTIAVLIAIIGLVGIKIKGQ